MFFNLFIINKLKILNFNELKKHNIVIPNAYIHIYDSSLRIWIQLMNGFIKRGKLSMDIYKPSFHSKIMLVSSKSIINIAPVHGPTKGEFS